MEKTLEIKFMSFSKALDTCTESISLLEKHVYTDLYASMRDSLIQRFEYTFDIFWKYLRDYLLVQSKGDIAFERISPREIISKAMAYKYLSADEGRLLTRALDDRNITSHAYQQVLAQEISERIEAYCTLFTELKNRFRP